MAATAHPAVARRQQRRLDEARWRQTSRGGGTGDQRGQQDKRTCFRCDEQGHVAAVCPNPPKAAHSGRSGKGAGSSRGAGAGGHGGERADAATRARSHSSDEESDDDCLPQRGERVCATLSGKGSRADTDARGSASGARSYADVVKRKEANQQSAPLLEGPGCASGGAAPADATPVREKGRAAAAASTPRAEPLKREAVGAVGSGSAPPSTLAVSAAMSAAAPPAIAAKVPAEQKVAVATNTQGARSKTKPKAVPLDAALADDAWGWDSMASSCCSGNRARFVSLRKCAAVAARGGRRRRPCQPHRERGAPRGGRQRQGGAHRRRQRAVPRALLVEPAEQRASDQEAGLAAPQHPEGSYVVTPGGHRVTLSTAAEWRC